MRVEVYRNLHRRCWSVRALEGPDKGKVVEHKHRLTLLDPEFVVQPAGRDKARREGRKNVHAFIRGHLTDLFPYVGLNDRQVKYNPYKHDTFVDKYGNPVLKAGIVTLNGLGECWFV